MVNSRKNLKRDSYTELHHIVPRSVYGKNILSEEGLSHVNDPKNIVELTGREHFVAHWLLYRAFPNVMQFAGAFHAMASMSNSHHHRYTPSSRAIEEARKAYADSLKLPVAQYSLEGQLIQIFDTTEDAAIEVNSNVSNISAACNEENQVNNIKGFLWRRFEKNPSEKIKPYINQNDESSLMVHEYDLSGKFIQSFSSIREASRNDIPRSGLKSKYRNKPIHSKNNWYVISDEMPKPKIEVKKQNTQRRRVHQIDPKTGVIVKTWNSTREPQKVLGISNVSSVCNGKRKSMGGFIWKYAEEEYELNIAEHKRKLPRAYSIIIYKNEKIIGEFESLRKAESSTGIKRALLSKILKTKKPEKGIYVEKRNVNVSQQGK